MNGIKIFGKNGNHFKFDTELFTKIIGKGSGQLALYSVVGESMAKNEIFLNYFIDYFGKTQLWYASEQHHTYRPCPEELNEETASIWLLPMPFTKLRDSNEEEGKAVSIFLLNSRLCSKGKSPMQDNALVLALTTQLSSVMIMNINDVFEEGSLLTLSHSAEFAKYEMNEDKPFPKLIFFYHQWSAQKQGCLEYSPGIHDDEHSGEPPNDRFNFKSDFWYLQSVSERSDKERYVRESLSSTFDEIVFCLSEHRLDDTELLFSEEMGSHPKGLYYPWKVIRSICDSDRIIPKTTIDDSVKALEHLKSWNDIFESHTIPANISDTDLMYCYFNQIAVNSAIDYYYRKVNEFLKPGYQHLDYEDYQM